MVVAFFIVGLFIFNFLASPVNAASCIPQSTPIPAGVTCSGHFTQSNNCYQGSSATAACLCSYTTTSHNTCSNSQTYVDYAFTSADYQTGSGFAVSNPSCAASSAACEACCQNTAIAPACDSTCGKGACGVRLSDGSCYADWGNAVYKLGCCKLGRCVGCNSCTYIVSSETFECGSNEGCLALCPPTPVPTSTPVPVSTSVPTSTPTATPSPTPTAGCKSLSELRAFTYQTSFLPWWQTIGGDVHADGEVSSAIPAFPPCVAPNSPYLSLPGDGGTSGIVSYGSTLNLGQGEVSENSWQVRTAYTGPRVNFDYLVHRLKVDDRVNTFDGTMPTESGTYYFTGDKDLEGSFPAAEGSFPAAGKKIIIFVDGNVKVTNDIVVPNDASNSFFALIVKGDLNFTNSVNNAHGIYITNGTLTINTGSTQFKGEGSFIAWTDVSLERDLGTQENNCTPAHLFTQRPDLLVNAPSTFKIADSYFKEVAP